MSVPSVRREPTIFKMRNREAETQIDIEAGTEARARGQGQAVGWESYVCGKLGHWARDSSKRKSGPDEERNKA